VSSRNCANVFSLLIRRKHRKPKPVLPADSVSKYYSETAKSTYAGIFVTPLEVMSVFASASAISPLIRIDVCLPPLPTLIGQLKFDDRPDPGDLEGNWFKMDHDAILKERMVRATGEGSDACPASWYQSLSGVIVSLIHQFIMLHQGYHTAGGRKDSYDFDPDNASKAHFDTTHVAKLMMRVAQIPPGGPFLVHTFDLEQWRGHYASHGVDRDYGIAEEFIRNSNKMDRARTAEFRELANGDLDGYMEEGELDEGVSDGWAETERLSNDIDNQLAEAGVEREFYVLNDFCLAHQYPAAPLRDPEWQPWLAAMASTDIYGQLSIMYRRLCAVQTGANVVAAAMQRRAQDLEADKMLLLTKAKEVKDAFATIKKTERNISSTKTHIGALNDEVRGIMEVPGVQRVLALSGDLGGDRSERWSYLYLIPPLSADGQGLHTRAQRDPQSRD
jgi:hypothetical protein